MGRVYSRKATKFLWIRHLQHGRVIRESTQTDNIVKARRILRDREGVEKGVPINPAVERITFDDATTDLLNGPHQASTRSIAANTSSGANGFDT